MSRTVGIEIEGCGIYPDQCKIALRNAGISTTGRNGWKCKTDGTSGVTFEIASPAMDISGDWQEKTRTVCEALRNAGARVSRSCGIHVHVDINDHSVDHICRLVRIWSQVEGAVNNVLSRSRQTNGFCRNNVGNLGAWTIGVPHSIYRKETVAKTLRAMATGGRYHKMNLASFHKYGTVEFRGHQGSLNATKIINWVRLCASVVEWAKGTRTIDGARTTGMNLPEALEIMSVYAFNTDEELTGVTVSRSSNPRTGSMKESLFAIYDANATLGVREAATLAMSTLGCTRKLATDNHWHWRKATTVSRTVNENTASANADRRSSWVAYFVERASELEIDNQYIGSDVQDSSYINS